MRGHGQRIIEIGKRSDKATGFVLPPPSRVAERTFAWLDRCRTLAKDWVKSIVSAAAGAQIASV
jgi:putative transposase